MINVKQFEKNVMVDGQKVISKLPIFIVDFEAGTQPSDVYEVNRVCYCVVQWKSSKIVIMLYGATNANVLGIFLKIVTKKLSACWVQKIIV